MTRSNFPNLILSSSERHDYSFIMESVLLVWLILIILRDYLSVVESEALDSEYCNRITIYIYYNICVDDSKSAGGFKG